jgi:hypothetical protein
MVKNMIISLSTALLVVVICLFSILELNAYTACEGSGANVWCETDGPNTCRIRMTACIDPEENPCSGVWRFYYKPPEGAWQWILLDESGICESPCRLFTCAVRGLPCNTTYSWKIWCTSWTEAHLPWDAGSVNCSSE